MTTLAPLGGFGFSYENYSTGVTNNLMNATNRDEFTHKFTANTSMIQPRPRDSWVI